MKEQAEILSQYIPSQSNSELQELHEGQVIMIVEMKEWSIPNINEQETGVII